MKTNSRKYSTLFAVFHQLVLCYVITIKSTVSVEIQQPTLRGLTVMQPPFTEHDSNGIIRGFYVDMLDRIAAIGGFKYSLELIMLSTTQILDDQNPASFFARGLDYELQKHSLENPETTWFALAPHLTTFITNHKNGSYNHNQSSDKWSKTSPMQSESHQKYEITEPYIVSGFSALGRQAIFEEYGIHQAKDLLRQQQSKPPITFGTIELVYKKIAKMKDPTIAQIHNRLEMVEDLEYGLERVYNEPFVLIQEQLNNEFFVDQNCELQHVVLVPEDGNNTEAQLGYIIKVSPGTHAKLANIVHLFNDAIRELKSNGEMEELRRKYWNQQYNSGWRRGQNFSMLTTILPFMVVIISIF